MRISCILDGMGNSDYKAIDKDLFRKKMIQWGQSDLAIRSFEQKLDELASGKSSLIHENELEPVESLPRLKDLGWDFQVAGKKLLKKAVMIKLNGGLGTSMGMDRAKSLLTAKQGLTFLDIIVKHAGAQQAALLLMNSRRTRKESLELIRKYSHIRKQERNLPLDFEQSMNPKVEKASLRPAEYPSDPEMEWCPPGHGDLFTAIQENDTLEKLLEAGYEYAFISNSDNLCASLHPGILGYISSRKIPFLMEVTRRTVNDRKGGHLARSAIDGSLLLRESAQCPDEDLESFQDIEFHRFFNTNNLWISLPMLNDTLKQNNGIIDLPLIRNEKRVNPVDENSTEVYQLESAMGAAINFFPGAEALEVPRSRFLPVKSCEDLLLVRSDRVVLIHDDYTMTQCRSCSQFEIKIRLDDRYYKHIKDWEKAFPGKVPSLEDCTEFCVTGPFLFQDNVKAVDKVTLNNPGEKRITIKEGTVLKGVWPEN